MKKVLLLLAILASCLSTVAQTTNFRYGNFVYEMHDGVEPYAWLLWPVGDVPSQITIPASIPMSGKEFPVTGIADSAFGYGKFDYEVNIASLTLPPTIKYFGHGAFGGVTSCNVYISSLDNWMKATFMPGGNPIKGSLYVNGAEMKSFVASPGMTSVPDYVFANCTSIVLVNLNGITSVGEGAFLGCSEMQSLNIADGVVELGERSFSRCSGLKKIYIPQSVKTIGEYAFSNCHGLGEVSFCEGLQDIEKGAFYMCTALKSVSLPTTVKNIKESAFEKSGLTEFVYMPENETVLGESVFSECQSLKIAHLSGKLTELPSKLFYNCTALETVYIGESISKLHGNAFEGCTALNRVEIPGIDSWFDKNLDPYKVQVHWNPAAYNYYYCFRDCPYSLYVNGERVENITVPDHITELRGGLFYKNIGLRSINLPKVKYIESHVFDWCNGLEKITITGELRGNNYIFSRVNGIKDIYYDTDTPEYFYDLFSDKTIQTATLHVRPEAMEKICQTEPWMNFVNIVADITDSGLDEIEAIDGEMMCDVYSIAGMKVRSGVKWAEWNAGLTPGIYIVRLADGTIRKLSQKN